MRGWRQSPLERVPCLPSVARPAAACSGPTPPGAEVGCLLCALLAPAACGRGAAASSATSVRRPPASWRWRVGLAAVAALVLASLQPFVARQGKRHRPDGVDEYRGLTAADWEAEVRHWEVVFESYSNKVGWRRVWRREGELGGERMQLLTDDPEAVPVLAKLLGSRDPKARRIAVQGLEKVGEQARPAVPALLAALDDPDDDVRQDAEQALTWIDREAAERAGLEYHPFFGIHRKRPE